MIIFLYWKKDEPIPRAMQNKDGTLRVAGESDDFSYFVSGYENYQWKPVRLKDFFEPEESRAIRGSDGFAERVKSPVHKMEKPVEDSTITQEEHERAIERFQEWAKEKPELPEEMSLNQDPTDIRFVTSVVNQLIQYLKSKNI